MKNFFAFFCGFLLILPSFAQKSWKTSIDGKAKIWTAESDDFLWNGNVLEKIANGNGKIEFFKNGKKIAFSRIKFTFGAENSDFIELFTGDKYAGEHKGNGEKSVPHGFGVLKKTNGSIYAGNFKNGVLTGNGTRFDEKGKILYKGKFLKGRYNGFGELFEDGKKIYEGEFKNGFRHGKGTEFIENSTLYGNWKNDKKIGEFEIKTNEITRFVKFSDGKADLSNAKILYRNAIEWNGALDNEFNPTGEGKIVYDSGDEYFGEVSENARNGFGEFKTKNGFSYSGEWENDEANGEGEAIFSSENENWHYTGGWNNGSFEGKGSILSDNFSYTGEWQNGERKGSGTLTVNGARYDGNFKDDRLNGSGIIVFPNGDYYSGEWLESVQEGYGEYHWADGNSYFGEWSEGLQNGNGELFLNDGSVYSGEFEDGRYVGEGIFCYTNGDIYEGEWKNNEKNGIGVYYFSDGGNYSGEFKNGKMDGKGRFKKADGSFYEGEFVNGNVFGRGSLFVPDGKDFVVLSSNQWNKNDFPDYGTITFPNGDEFVGSLKDGKPTQNGKWRSRGEKTVAETAYDFYKNHEESIESIADKTQLVLAGISLAGDVVGAVATPAPPVAGVALAVARVADALNLAVSGAKILVGTGVLAYETNDIAGDAQKIKELRKNYAKKQVWNFADIVFSASSSAWKSFRLGRNAKKAVEVFPNLKKAISKTGKLADAAKSAKVGDKFVRGTVEIAYGKVAKSLIGEYGDEAAEILFRYGDNAIDALTKNSATTLKLAKKSPKALNVALINGDSAFDLFAKFPRQTDEIAQILEKTGKHGIKTLNQLGKNAPIFLTLTSKHGDDFFKLTQKTSKENLESLLKITQKNGSDAIKIFSKCKNGSEMNRAIHFLNNGGTFAELQKSGGKIAKEKTISIIRRSKISFAKIENRLSQIRSKGKIVLSKKDIDWIKRDPKVNLRAMIRAKTGEKTLGAGFQEFFIRLADGNKNQVRELLEINEIRKTVNHAIRGSGGVHEWLMTKNYLDFLTNPKWGNDGAKISLALTELVQDTRTVAFKNGGTHFDKMNSGKFHDGLGKTIDSCSNATELVQKVKEYAEKSLTKESFAEFNEIFMRCFQL